jgi:hypothetical protein
MQLAISVNPNNPDVSFNVAELNAYLAAGWEVINGFSSTMQAVVVILEKKEVSTQSTE